ncbi:PAS domain S-box protein [Sphingomonas koreensis]|nr:PAS domain S-box protein [Sphingomonas koreensis]
MKFDHREIVDPHALFAEAAIDRALFLVDDTGRITSWNRGATLLTGWSANEITGEPVDRLYPAAERDGGVIESDRSKAARHGQINRDVWVLRRDGSEFFATLNINALIDAGGQSHGFGYRIEDITDRKAAEAALERSAEHLRSILKTVPDAMVVIDEHGIVISFSAAAERLFGYAAAMVVGHNVRMLMPHHHSNRHDSYIARYLETGERRIIGQDRIVVGRKRDGTEFPVELSIGEARSNGHRIFTGFVRDLTEQQRAELRLKQLQSELIHVSRLSAMGTMASTLAHELNQPLTAIANYLEAGRDLLDTPGARSHNLLREAMAEAAAESLRAGALVRRLREFVTRGEIDKRAEDLSVMIDEAGRLALLGARERGIRTFFCLDPACSRAMVDRVQIQQVVVNLLRNAMESLDTAPQRDIFVSTMREGADLVRVSITDTGPGLSDRMVDRLFQAFSTTKEHGMGLGLSICRTIIEAHNGRIWYEPRSGGGAAFHFTLIAADEDDG